MKVLSQTPKWGRLITALITPFQQDGTLNVPELRRLAAYVVDEQRNDGVVVSGTTGESPTLTEEEKLLALDTVLEVIGDRATVLFGAGTNNTQESIRLAKLGEQHGAHGLMLVNPPYNKPGQRGLFAHFQAIAERTSLPVMLYNIPGRTAINLEVATLRKLIQSCPNIVAVKEASGSLSQMSEICASVPEGFLVYSGDDLLTLPLLSVGGYGIVSVVGGVVGYLIREMIDDFFTCPERAIKMHQRLLPIYDILPMAPNPVPIKYATSLCGFDTEGVRLPLVNLTEEEKQRVQEALEQACCKSTKEEATMYSGT
jgi:4-hydroxy-tetrahydrodipicolinate synthase